MAIVTWYCVTRDSTVVAVPIKGTVVNSIYEKTDFICNFLKGERKKRA